jgi:hypothetical protein
MPVQRLLLRTTGRRPGASSASVLETAFHAAARRSQGWNGVWKLGELAMERWCALARAQPLDRGAAVAVRITRDAAGPEVAAARNEAPARDRGAG